MTRDRMDRAHAFVARQERRGWLDGPVAVGGVDVGMAQAGGLHPDGDLPGPWLGNWPVLDDERLPELSHDCSFHISST
jgi:hypothetical protein